MIVASEKHVLPLGARLAGHQILRGPELLCAHQRPPAPKLKIPIICQPHQSLKSRRCCTACESWLLASLVFLRNATPPNPSYGDIGIAENNHLLHAYPLSHHSRPRLDQGSRIHSYLYHRNYCHHIWTRASCERIHCQTASN